MSAVGRLWRRAPAWRVCLVVALAATALAAMFPPGVPGWARRAMTPATSVVAVAAVGGSAAGSPAVGVAAAGSPAAGGSAHYKPVAGPSDGGFSGWVFPPPGTARSGLVAFAGRQVPLPAGGWQTLVLARGGRPISGQIEVFGRVETGVMTGLLVMAAPDPITHPLSPFNEMETCDEPDTIASWVAPEPFGQGALVHECWRLSSMRGFDLAERARQESVLDHALLRLKETGVRIPDQLVLVDYLRSDDSGFLTALLFLPERHAGSRPAMIAWVKRYVAALHDAYDGVHGKAVPVDPGLAEAGK